MATDFRTAPRYFVTGVLPATFGNVTANIVDLSIRGARLHMTQSFSIGSTLPLSIEAAGQPCAVFRRVQQSLAAVLVAGNLADPALIDQQLQDARQALLGNLQDVQQVLNLKTGVAVDEV